MFFDKMFGSLFGFVWLVIFVVAVLGLLIWLLLKNDKVLINNSESEDEVKKDLFKEDYNNFVIEENEKGLFEVKNKKNEVLKFFSSLGDAHVFIDVLLLREEKENEENSNYEIVEINGSFKVRKKGSEKTIRKFNSEEEALNYVKEKECND